MQVTVEYEIKDLGDNLYQVSGPGLQQPQVLTGESAARSKVARLKDRNSPDPSQGSAVFSLELEIS